MQSAEKRAAVKISRVIGNITVFYCLMTFFIAGGFLCFLSFSDVKKLNSYDATTCISTGCTVRNWNSDQCVESKIAGCCDEEFCNNTIPGTYNFNKVYAKNLTSNVIDNSFNNNLLIEGVEFKNNTATFSCLINDFSCPAYFRDLTFESIVYVNNILSNSSLLTFNNGTQIDRSGILQALNNTVIFNNLNISNFICAGGNISSCSVNPIIANDVNMYPNGTIEVDLLNIVQQISAQNVILRLNQSFNLTEFVFGNSTVQAYNNGRFENMYFQPNGFKLGIGYNSTSSLQQTFNVNGTTAVTGINFGIANTSELWNTYQNYYWNTTFAGPWSSNISASIQVNIRGDQVSVFLPQIEALSVRNVSITTSVKFPVKYAPLNNITDSMSFDIITSSNSTYDGLPGYFSIFGDGTVMIQPTLPTDLPTSFSWNYSPITNYAPDNIAGFKATVITWALIPQLSIIS